jgi:hypothetical protein
VAMPVSFSGGLFAVDGPLRVPFARALAACAQPYRLTLPALAPVVGAALYAARSAGLALDEAACARLARAH